MVALVVGWICFIILSQLKLISLKLMSGTKVFTIFYKSPERELSEFYDGIALFMKLAIPYVTIYTVTNYFTRLWAL